MFDDLFDCMSAVAGGTLTAAEMLNRRECSIAINWEGGWHHAHRYTVQEWNLLCLFIAVFFKSTASSFLLRSQLHKFYTTPFKNVACVGVVFVILGSNFIFLCFILIITHYHTHKQGKINFELRKKLNHNIHVGSTAQASKKLKPSLSWNKH